MSAPNSLVTLQDIADRVGVSKNTVSRVLNGGVDYARPTFARRADRIRRLALQMGYRPNAAARAVTSGRFGAISLLLTPKAGLWLPPGLLRGLTRAAAEHDLQLILSELPDAKLTDAQYMPKALRELSVDGLLIDYLFELPPVLADLLQRHRIPAVYLNDRREGDCVYFDDEGALRDATRHMLELGHRRIAYIGGNPGMTHYSLGDRQRGYEQAMRGAGLTPRVMAMDRSLDPASRQAAIAAMLDQQPTAVLSYSIDQAEAVVGEALRRGLRIGPDLAIIAIDFRPQASAAGVPLDTLPLPQGEMADAALEAITRKVARPDEVLVPVAIPFESIQKAGSVCPPASLS